MSERSETTTEAMGTQMVQRAKRLTVYKVARDLGKGMGSHGQPDRIPEKLG